MAEINIPTLKEILDAIAVNLRLIPEVEDTVQGHDELGEGMNDYPAIQIYPEEGEPNITGSTAQLTFGAKTRVERILINVDVFAKQRADLGEDMAAVVTIFDKIRTHLKGIKEKPYFGLEGIQAFDWKWERTVFEYAGNKYMSLRFVLTVYTF